MFRLVGHLLPHSRTECEASGLDHPENLSVRPPVKWDLATEQDKHDDAATPCVRLPTVPANDDLGCNVIRRPQARRQDLTGFAEAGEAEIDDLQGVPLDRLRAAQQEVFRFDVPVANVAVVDVVHAPEDLLHDERRVVLREVPGGDDVVEEVASGAELHDEVEALAVLEELEELDDVGVVHHLHDLDLLLEAEHVLHPQAVDGLDGPLRPGHLVGGHADSARVAGAQGGTVGGVELLDLPAVAEDALHVADVQRIHRRQRRRARRRPRLGRREGGAPRG
mmetsp:Transcript_117288/g.328260  ORF Transcript_117288/g.328260 Transcript_117288/m.328260 type:complete len:279 (+) Transcript_117288:813-1649(+)